MFIARVLERASKRLVTIEATAPLTYAAQLLSRPQINLVVVCAFDGAMVGVITKTDVVRHISSCRGRACTVEAGAVMTRNVIRCHPDDLLQDAWAIMKERSLPHIPIVCQDSKPCGVLNARDALQALLEEIEDEELLLRHYVMGIGYQ